MLHKLQVLAIALILGVFSCCNAAAITHHDEPLKPGKPIGLHDLLTTGENFSNSAGQLQINTGGPGDIHFLKVYFYSSSNNTDCTGTLTLLGVASAVDNVSGFSFINGQTVSLNGNAAFTLASNKSIPTASIKCIKLYVDGGNDTSNAVSCQQFNEDCSSGTSCLSGQTQPATWSTANHNSPCSTRNVYFVETNSGDNKVFKCSINEGDGSISCDSGTTTGSTGSSGIAINNGYAYISNTSGNVFKCTVAGDGSIVALSCAITPSSTTGFFTNAAGITLNYKYAYVATSTNSPPITYSIVRCEVSPTDGSIDSSTCGPVASGASFSGPSGMAISNGFNYITNTNTLASTVIPCAVTPGTGALSCNAATGTGFTAPLGIAISNSFAYVANSFSGNNTVRLCTAASGVLSPCGDAAGFVNKPAGIAINNAFAYITSAETTPFGAVLVYSINSGTGVLTFASQQQVSTANTPKPITIY